MCNVVTCGVCLTLDRPGWKTEKLSVGMTSGVETEGKIEVEDYHGRLESVVQHEVGERCATVFCAVCMGIVTKEFRNVMMCFPWPLKRPEDGNEFLEHLEVFVFVVCPRCKSRRDPSCEMTMMDGGTVSKIVVNLSMYAGSQNYLSPVLYEQVVVVNDMDMSVKSF